ncbi:MAG: glycosyltransferase [Firmicutes bacterium]|nr:glycosyltransferase [Bacillota bacterium]
MDEPLVSIIVPAYNSEKYIARCIDSILNQEYRNIELIVIDDGSTDGTGAILDKYAASDARMRVLHRDNSGVSASRNAGLDEAHGKYIEFADSDDWLTSDATKQLVRIAESEGCDMVIADFYRVMGNRLSVKGDIDVDHVMDRMEFSSYMIENPADFYYGVLWNKLYRRGIIESHNIRMDVLINWCEDFLFNLEYIRFAKTFYALSSPIYYYVHRRGSLVSQGSNIGKTIKMKINVFEYYSTFYKEVYEEDYDDIKLKVRRFLIDSAGDGFVTPALGSTKLGDERISLPGQEVYCAEGMIPRLYRVQKLFEYCISKVSSKRHMTDGEVKLLMLFSDVGSFASFDEIANMVDMSSQRVTHYVQRLRRLEYIKAVSESKTEVAFSLRRKGEDVVAEVSYVLEDAKKSCAKELSEREVSAFEKTIDTLDRGAMDYLRLIAGKDFWEGTTTE